MNGPKCALELWVSGTSGDSEGQDIYKCYSMDSLTKQDQEVGVRLTPRVLMCWVVRNFGGGPGYVGFAEWVRITWDTTLVGVIPGTNKTLHFLCIDTEARGPFLFRRPICVSTNLCVISVCQPASNDTSSVCHQQLSPLLLSPNHYTSAAESWSKWAPNFLGDKMLSKNEPKPQDAIETDISEKVSGKHPEKTWYPPSPGNLSVTAASPSNWFIGMYYFPPIPFPPQASRPHPFVD